MSDDEVREWVRGRLAFEAWLKAIHAARDAEQARDEELTIAVEPPPVAGARRFRVLRPGSRQEAEPSRRPTAA